MIKVAISCGGTGGHILPALCVAQELKGSGVEVIFVTSERAINKKIMDLHDFKVYKIKAEMMPGVFSPRIITFLFSLFAGVLSCMRFIKNEKPDAIAGFGGYVSAPLVLAAFVLRKPIIIHEQNVIPGKATRFLSFFADKVAVSFEKTKEYLKGRKVFTAGNPVRRQFFETNKQQACQRLGVDEDKFKILVVGGSQGSHRINLSIVDAVKAVEEPQRRKLCIIHLAGCEDKEFVKQKYREINIDNRVYDFMSDIWNGIHASDLVISRCGAGVISEISACAKPSILIPYPYAGAHQVANARELDSRGAGFIFYDSQLSGPLLKEKIDLFLMENGLAEKMGKNAHSLCKANAANLLADEILKAVDGKRST